MSAVRDCSFINLQGIFEKYIPASDFRTILSYFKALFGCEEVDRSLVTMLAILE